LLCRGRLVATAKKEREARRSENGGTIGTVSRNRLDPCRGPSGVCGAVTRIGSIPLRIAAITSLIWSPAAWVKVTNRRRRLACWVRRATPGSSKGRPALRGLR
jgi:hypothetical protein